MVVISVKSVLNKGQKIKFQESCFKNFYKLSNYRFSRQLIHSLLLWKFLPCKSIREIWLSIKVLRFSSFKFWIAIGLKLMNEDRLVDVEKDSTLFVTKYFNKFSIIKHLEFLVYWIGRPNPRTVTTRKNKHGMKKNDIGSSSKSPKRKQVTGSKFEFVEKDVIIYMTFLKCCLFVILKNLCL